MEYNFKEIEQKWQQYWKQNATNKTSDDASKPKYYVLDMFPYPSGAGLHVGHPLGYIASDIFARHKKLQGYNVLHPMGYVRLDYLLSNMLFKQVNTLPLLLKKILPAIVNNSTV